MYDDMYQVHAIAVDMWHKTLFVEIVYFLCSCLKLTIVSFHPKR